MNMLTIPASLDDRIRCPHCQSSRFKIVDYIISMREYIGFSFITLCSTKEGLHLYQRSGFEPIDEDMIIIQDESEKGCYQMYYPLDIE